MLLEILFGRYICSIFIIVTNIPTSPSIYAKVRKLESH